MVEDGVALCIAGNHDQKLARALSGRNVKMSHGLERSLEQLECAPALKADAGRFSGRADQPLRPRRREARRCPGGLKEEMQGRASARVREFALYGETTGESDEFGRPIRLDWVQNYRGGALVVYGHVAVTELRWVNNTVNIDTGCVFGGRLSALRKGDRIRTGVADLLRTGPPAR
jgi:protein phosphatase